MSRISVREIRQRLREATEERRRVSRELRLEPRLSEHVRATIAELTAQRRAAQPVVIGDREAELAERARIDAARAQKAREDAPAQKIRGARRSARVREEACS